MSPADAPTSTEPHDSGMRLALPNWRADGDDAARVIRDLDAWVGSSAVRSIVEAHGDRADAASPGPYLRDRASDTDARTTGADGQMTDADERVADLDGPETDADGPRRLLDRLVAFSDRWDARAGRERDRAAPTSWPQPVVDAVDAASAVLGLSDREVPPADSYDAIVMTGGMVRAEIVKPRFVRELVERGVTGERIVFLGAFRPFSDGERSLASALGMTARDEYDAMVEGLGRSFPGTSPIVVTGEGDAGPSAWRETHWTSGTTRAAVVAAPSTDVERGRADTTDTFRFWASRVAASVRSVLIVTTPVYVPYQAAVAVDVLGREHGMRVDTVGVSAMASDLGPLTQPFLTQHHLQELRSALRAMRALRSSLSVG